jgi:hypothetical protein
MQNNDTAGRLSRGPSELRRVPVEAVVATEELTNDSCSQIAIGQPNCPQPNCFLCSCELHLTSFHSQLSQQESINHLPTPFKEPGKDVDFLPCSLTIITLIQRVSKSMPLRSLFDGGSDTTFIHDECLPPGATPKLIQGCSGQTLASLLHTNRMV